MGSKKLDLVKRTKVPQNIIDYMHEQYKIPKCTTLGDLDPVFEELMRNALEKKSCHVVTVPILTPDTSLCKLL